MLERIAELDKEKAQMSGLMVCMCVCIYVCMYVCTYIRT